MAIGDFDKDVVHEVAGIDTSTHTLGVRHFDTNEPTHAKVLRTGVDISGAALMSVRSAPQPIRGEGWS